MIRAIIIDDEPSAINVLSILLKKYCNDDVEVVATSTSPHDARTLIDQYQPDLVFLDIEMPGMSGIDIIRSIENPQFRFVFVTAYDVYAIEAFELSAIDYLLKPIGADKVQRVIHKVKEVIHKKQFLVNTQLQQLETLLKLHSLKSEKKIGIGMSDKIIFVNIGEILYCEAQGAYTKVYLNSGKSILTSKPLGDFEDQLSSQNFFRIHHSYIINLNKVKEFQKNDGAYVIMENGLKLEISTRKKKEFLTVMNNFVI